MAYIDDLIIGQLDTNDTVPLNYCTPDAYYEGLYYEGNDYKLPSYKKSKDVVPAFNYTNNIMPNIVLKKAKEFIKSNYPSTITPTQVGNETIIGIGHKLQEAEISNMLLAFNDSSILKLDHPDVAKIIRKNHPYLKGTMLFKNGIVDYATANRSIAVYDEQNNFYVYSLVNGARPELISRLLSLDLQIAFDIVADKIKVPVNNNQFIALLSLAFDLGNDKFTTSKIVKCLNSGDYQCATYFMEFAEIPLKASLGVSTFLFNRRNAEANLFTSI
jgi:hypothetical protein